MLRGHCTPDRGGTGVMQGASGFTQGRPSGRDIVDDEDARVGYQQRFADVHLILDLREALGGACAAEHESTG